MNDLKFYQFKQKLMYKCIKNNKKVFFINESYTSKTCSSCGYIWRELKNKKVFECQSCKEVYDRDINAAKNICMKGMLSC